MSCTKKGLPQGLTGKESTCNAGGAEDDPLVGKIPWRMAMATIPVFLPGESRGQRSLMGYSPWCCKEVVRAEATKHVAQMSG